MAQANLGQPKKKPRATQESGTAVPRGTNRRFARKDMVLVPAQTIRGLPDFLPEQREQPGSDHQQKGDNDGSEHLLALGAIGKLARQQAPKRLAEDEAGDE